MVRVAMATLLLFLAVPPRAADPSPEGIEFFEKKIRPLLVKHCYACHAADAKKLKGDLLLDTRDGVLKGGASGPAVVPGDPAKSLLIKAVRHADDDAARCRRRRSSPAAEIADLEAWVKMGAPDPRTAAAATKRLDLDEGAGVLVVPARSRDPAVPAVEGRPGRQPDRPRSSSRSSRRRA